MYYIPIYYLSSIYFLITLSLNYNIDNTFFYFTLIYIPTSIVSESIIFDCISIAQKDDFIGALYDQLCN